MPVAVDRRWTVAELDALPADPTHRYEIVDGELLVSPGPLLPHQKAVLEVTKLLDGYVGAMPDIEVLNGPGEVIPEEYTAMQPDVFVFDVRGGALDRRWDDSCRLLLAVEVSSAGTARYDRVTKRPKYLALDAVYWIVDPDARLSARSGYQGPPARRSARSEWSGVLPRPKNRW